MLPVSDDLPAILLPLRRVCAPVGEAHVSDQTRAMCPSILVVRIGISGALRCKVPSMDIAAESIEHALPREQDDARDLRKVARTRPAGDSLRQSGIHAAALVQAEA